MKRICLILAATFATAATFAQNNLRSTSPDSSGRSINRSRTTQPSGLNNNQINNPNNNGAAAPLNNITPNNPSNMQPNNNNMNNNTTTPPGTIPQPGTTTTPGQNNSGTPAQPGSTK